MGWSSSTRSCCGTSRAKCALQYDPAMISRRAYALAGLILVMIVWGITYVVTKAAVRGHLEPCIPAGSCGLTDAAPTRSLELTGSGGLVNHACCLTLLLSSALTLLGSGCAHVQPTVSSSAPHLPTRVMAKSATPTSSATREPVCPSSPRPPAPAFPRDSVEASWRWPELVWRASCPGGLPVTVVGRR